MKRIYFKALFCIIINLISINMFCQTSELFAYICNYAVNTGTGERRLFDSPLYFYCRFNSDKTICYWTHSNGKLKSDNDYNNRYDYGCFNSKGQYQYIFSETTNGVNVYVRKFSYYHRRKWGAKGWEFSDYKEAGPFYMYFSPDYNRINEPFGANEVLVYERFYPDQHGQPSQMW